MYDQTNEVLLERRALAMGRIREIHSENQAAAPFGDYFQKTAGFLLQTDQARAQLISGRERSAAAWQAENAALYEDVLPQNYDHSYANPVYAAAELGAEHGKLLCFLSAQLRGLIGWQFEGLLEICVIHLELFVEIYNQFLAAGVPDVRDLKQTLYWFMHDNCDILVAERLRQSVDPARDHAVSIVMTSDLSDLRYLYRYGEYVTEDELTLARFLNDLPQEEIDRIARTYTEGYRVGFVKAGKDLGKKLTVNIRYHLGFERVVRAAILQFQAMGLRPVIFRHALSAVNRRGTQRIGYTGAVANDQYDYDHREDAALYLDKRFVQRRLDVMHKTYEVFQTLANAHAGPAVIETFGERPFSPAAHAFAWQLSEKQQQLMVQMNNEAARLTNRYIIGEERSFTIIAFPLPQIGPHFPEIFGDTVKINTLDAHVYEAIQQRLIDALDTGVQAHILGRGANKTDLRVRFWDLADPSRETIFENCVADVNIPVGEVFTSPQLAGTNGVLHVTQVYLQGLNYENLSLTFTDGMITDYSCSNFADPAKGREYIRANVLFHHDTLPMGEFAIGTNTAAYVMGRKYGIGALLPILIAEKTGPHFAVGDTCYSWEEEIKVYNPDGKECVARDNAISLLRKEDPGKAYFGCHTDITIPYAELGLIEVIDAAGKATALIKDGRFVLPGTEALNEALDEERSISWQK